jgi:hypothetical protein
VNNFILYVQKRFAEEEAEAQKKRCQMLKHLLGKSEFYSEYIANAMARNKAESAK